QRLEPHGWRIDVEFLVTHAFGYRLNDGGVRRKVVCVLAEPFQAWRVHELVEMGVANFKIFHLTLKAHGKASSLKKGPFLGKAKFACQQGLLACKNGTK